MAKVTGPAAIAALKDALAKNPYRGMPACVPGKASQAKAERGTAKDPPVKPHPVTAKRFTKKTAHEETPDISPAAMPAPKSALKRGRDQHADKHVSFEEPAAARAKVSENAPSKVGPPPAQGQPAQGQPAQEPPAETQPTPEAPAQGQPAPAQGQPALEAPAPRDTKETCTAIAAEQPDPVLPKASAAVYPGATTAAPAIIPGVLADKASIKTEPAEDQMSVVEAADRAAAAKKKLNDAMHKRFRRSIEPAPKQRAARGKRCPPALALKIKAMPAAEVADICQIFGEVNEDWLEAEARIEARESTKELDRMRQGWFTRHQLLDKYNQDEVFVDGVIQQKLKNPKLWMAHPDNPGSEAHRLYKAVDFISETTDKEKEVSKTISQGAALEQATVMPLLSTFRMPLANSNLSSSSSLDRLAIQDAGPQKLDQTAPDAQQGKSPEMLAFEAAQKLKTDKLAARKAEAERLKALPATQAKKWENVLGKHCNDCKGYVADIQSSKCPDDVKTNNVKDFRAMLKRLVTARSSLQTCETNAETEQLIADAPSLEVEFKSLIKKWKKVNKLLG